LTCTRHAATPQSPTQMITMLRKCAMVIHILMWSVCYGKPKGVSRREDCVCVVRGGQVQSMPMHVRVRCMGATAHWRGSEGGEGGRSWEHVRVLSRPHDSTRA
jgi:hypothetical protein